MYLFVVPLQFLDGGHEICPGCTSVEVEHWLPNAGSSRGRWGGRSWRIEGEQTVKLGRTLSHLNTVFSLKLKTRLRELATAQDAGSRNLVFAF